MKKPVLIAWLSIACLFSACTKKDNAPLAPEKGDTTTHKIPARFQFLVKSVADSSAVQGASVILYNAINDSAVSRFTTGTDGGCDSALDSGSYYPRITAQGHKPMPMEFQAPAPFIARAGDTVKKTYYLDTLAAAGPGKIMGVTINAGSAQPLSGALVIAEDTLSHARYTATTGPDGVFTLFNLKAGTYRLTALKGGYRAEIAQPVNVTTSSAAVDTLRMAVEAGATLSGTLSAPTAAAARNVEIDLLDTATFCRIAGMSALTNDSGGYLISGIPPGVYFVWASLNNDNYVLDPGKQKLISILESNPEPTHSPAITSAVTLISPTNAPDSVFPAAADSARPRFVWHKYPGAKEYLLEVSDANRRVIWGGPAGTDTSGRIPVVQDTSARYNFDLTAKSAALVPGQTYQWKVYADSDSSAITRFISSSEDRMGYFTVPK